MTAPYDTKNPLPAAARKTVADALRSPLAEALHLTVAAKRAHWNVKGPQFLPLHELFDAVHGEVAGFADQLAERIVQLGFAVDATLDEIRERSALEEGALRTSGAAWTGAVAGWLGGFIGRVQAALAKSEAADDAVTTDLLTVISATAQKRLWFVEAHLQ